MTHYITIHFGSGIGKKVSIRSYIDAIKYAKSHPEQIFSEGLRQWWPVSGKEIYRDYLDSILHRINEKAGESWRNTRSDEEYNEILFVPEMAFWQRLRILRWENRLLSILVTN